MNINWKPNYIPGDLVYNHKGEVIRITSSYLKGTRLFYYKTDKIDESTGCILEKALKPIPLTVEILEKNGWKKSKNSGFNHVYYKDELFLTFISKNCKFWFNDLDYGSSICVDLSYVHELQHLLFGLGFKSEMEV